MLKRGIIGAAAALLLFGLAGALVYRHGGLAGRAAQAPAGWTEVQWPFPTDQFGRGRAFACGAAQCGVPVTLYVRAKIGFCNCAEGVADDAELERVGDLELLGGQFSAQGDGRPIAVAHMKGRSRSYALTGNSHPGRAALSIGYNDRCDAIVAIAVVQHDRPGDIEQTVIGFLNGPAVMRYIEVALGL